MALPPLKHGKITHSKRQHYANDPCKDSTHGFVCPGPRSRPAKENPLAPANALAPALPPAPLLLLLAPQAQLPPDEPDLDPLPAPDPIPELPANDAVLPLSPLHHMVRSTALSSLNLHASHQPDSSADTGASDASLLFSAGVADTSDASEAGDTSEFAGDIGMCMDAGEEYDEGMGLEIEEGIGQTAFASPAASLSHHPMPSPSRSQIRMTVSTADGSFKSAADDGMLMGLDSMHDITGMEGDEGAEMIYGKDGTAATESGSNLDEWMEGEGDDEVAAGPADELLDDALGALAFQRRLHGTSSLVLYDGTEPHLSSALYISGSGSFFPSLPSIPNPLANAAAAFESPVNGGMCVEMGHAQDVEDDMLIDFDLLEHSEPTAAHSNVTINSSSSSSSPSLQLLLERACRADGSGATVVTKARTDGADVRIAAGMVDIGGPADVQIEDALGVVAFQRHLHNMSSLVLYVGSDISSSMDSDACRAEVISPNDSIFPYLALTLPTDQPSSSASLHVPTSSASLSSYPSISNPALLVAGSVDERTYSESGGDVDMDVSDAELGMSNEEVVGYEEDMGMDLDLDAEAVAEPNTNDVAHGADVSTFLPSPLNISHTPLLAVDGHTAAGSVSPNSGQDVAIAEVPASVTQSRPTTGLRIFSRTRHSMTDVVEFIGDDSSSSAMVATYDTLSSPLSIPKHSHSAPTTNTDPTSPDSPNLSLATSAHLHQLDKSFEDYTMEEIACISGNELEALWMAYGGGVEVPSTRYCAPMRSSADTIAAFDNIAMLISGPIAVPISQQAITDESIEVWSYVLKNVLGAFWLASDLDKERALEILERLASGRVDFALLERALDLRRTVKRLSQLEDFGVHQELAATVEEKWGTQFNS